MARIRTIKPEFPQSESMGRVSRDARLLFIMLWTLADDAGRLRGNSRMLASLLFPYDDDAKTLLPVWLAELQSESCVDCYKSGSDTYIQVCNWLIHQKIDKPSKSKIPAFDAASRILANPRESSSGDQGSRIKDQGVDQGQDQEPAAEAPAKKTSAAKGGRLPSDWLLPDDWKPDAIAAGVPGGAVDLEGSKFRDYWVAKTGKDATKHDWQATWRNWCRNAVARTYRPTQGKTSKHDLSQMDYSKGVTADGKF